MSFTVEPLEIPDVVVVSPTLRRDTRGWFMETYRASVFEALGLPEHFVQDNLVRSVRGALRGMHYQLDPAAQGKLVSVVHGRIFDVAVDVRGGSESYGRWVGRLLDEASGESLWIPPGFAHGYIVLSENAYVSYKVTAEYRPELDGGFRWDDPEVGILWPLDDPLLSDRDRNLPFLADLVPPFRVG
jgi:dTDP-4-dehydrorhamnose 3,5-epimerase